jgi:cell division protein FtsL
MTPPAGAAAHATTTPPSRVRRGPAPRAPRRVSGPAARPARLAANSGAVALPRPRPRNPLPPGLPRRALRTAGQVVDHHLLERLVTGRAWIGLIAFALFGIVFMQVSLLKINAGIGVAVEKAQVLERQNSELRAEVSQLSSNDRVQEVAGRLGLVLPPAGAVTFLGENGERIGGDGVTALASGTATAPELAGTGSAATAATPGATPIPAPATTTTDPAAATTTDPATAAPATTSTPAPTTTTTSTAPATTSTTAPAPESTAAGGATPAATQP